MTILTLTFNPVTIVVDDPPLDQEYEWFPFVDAEAGPVTANTDLQSLEDAVLDAIRDWMRQQWARRCPEIRCPDLAIGVTQPVHPRVHLIDEFGTEPF